MQRVKSHEKRKILLFGESLRENPGTILLSIPVFMIGYIYYWFVGDKQGIAGSLGHGGITFKNYYRHHWHRKFLLKISFKLFMISANYAKGEGKVSTILHAAQSAYELGDLNLAGNLYKGALREAGKIGHRAIKGNIHSHMATVEIERKDFSKAKKYLDDSYNDLTDELNKAPNSLYLHVWLSRTEIVMSEYFLARGDKKNAKLWMKKAKDRIDKYDLKTREKDVEKLSRKLE